MSVTIKGSKMNYKDSQGNYVGVDVVAERSTEEIVDVVRTEGTSQMSNISTAGATALTNIQNKADEVTSQLASSGEMEDMIADTFEGNKNYAEGKYIIHTNNQQVNKLYNYTKDHTAGSWDGTEVREAKLADDVSDLKSALSHNMADASLFEQGGISSSNGNNADNNTRIRTSRYIDKRIYGVIANSGYKLAVYAWGDSYNGVWNGTTFVKTGITWFTTYVDIRKLGNYNFKIVLAKTGDGQISVSDGANAIFTVPEYAMEIDIDYVNKIIALENGTYQKNSNIKAYAGNTFYGQNMFTSPLNKAGEKVRIRYECDASIFPTGLYFISSNGKYLSDSATLYLPNTDYTVTIGETFASTASENCGFYGDGTLVSGSGEVVAYFYMDALEDDIATVKKIISDLEEDINNSLDDIKDDIGTSYTLKEKNATSGSAFDGRLFTTPSDLSGKKVKIRYDCDPSIFPTGLFFISGNGKYLSDSADKYLPNTDYIVQVGDTFAASASSICGFYGDGTLVSASGGVSMKLYADYNKSNDNLRNDIDEIEEKKTLTDKQLWTLWDSLGHNTWQNYFKQISGCEFNSELNVKPDKPLSWGGSNSWPSSDDGTQARAINLQSYKGTYPIDIIILENINDVNFMNKVGTSSDAPFMRSQKITIDTGATSYADAVQYANNNLSTILANVASANRKKGSILSFTYTSGSSICGSKVTFTHAPTSAGNISIVWGGNTYSIPVTTNMTTEDIANEFAKYSFGQGVSDTVNGSSITITNYTTTTARATFDGASTGVTATVEDSPGIGSYNLFFYGVGSSDWTNTTKWSENMTLYSAYKGLMAYLQTEFPKALIYLATPWAAGVDFSASTYKDDSGAWSVDLFTLPYAALYQVQKDVCEMYNIPVLELDKKSGMSIINIETYFNSNNVHPKTVGYQKYASTILNMIGIIN